MSDKSRRERGYEEIVTRFFAYSDGLDDYHDRPSDFFFDYSKAMNKRFAEAPALALEYAARFQQMLQFVERSFPYGFARSPKGIIPRARFESIAIGTGEALKQRPDLASRSASELNVQTWLESDEFSKVTGADGANAKARLLGRIAFVLERLFRHEHGRVE